MSNIKYPFEEGDIYYALAYNCEMPGKLPSDARTSVVWFESMWDCGSLDIWDEDLARDPDCDPGARLFSPAQMAHIEQAFAKYPGERWLYRHVDFMNYPEGTDMKNIFHNQI